MKSFFLEIDIGDEKVFLAGWPRSTQFSAENLDWFDGYITETRQWASRKDAFDRSKIVQYGIGFSDNTEVIADEEGYLIHPYIVEYVDAEGRMEKYRAGEPLPRGIHVINGKAVITIDENYNVTYRTVSLEFTAR